MKNLKILYLNIFLFVLLNNINAQNWTTSGNVIGATDYFGTNNNFALKTYTNSVERMRINANTGATAGFVGINTVNPLFRLHVQGSGVATSQGWTKGIMLSNDGALMWNGSPNTNRNYFMAHASNTPNGDFYQGYSVGIGAGATVNYASKVHVASGSPGPAASTQIFKWLLIQEANFERRFGVNTLNPIRTAEIKNTNSNNWQLRLTHQNNSWTDFKTR